MPKLIILGSSNAVPDENHENTHMALAGAERLALIDCVGSPVVRFKKAGLDLLALTDLILTHFHPDHISGVPNLLMSSWLLGRKTPLHMYGLPYTLDRLEALMRSFEWEAWPNFYPVHFHRLPSEEKHLLFDSPEFRVFSSPVRHLIPNIGLRIEFPHNGKAMAYSCDTEPCPEVIGLAQGVDLLVHEAAGANRGHTSAAQAGEVAAQAGAARLALIHYRTGDFDGARLIEQARQNFSGPVELAQDFMEYSF